MAVSRYQKQKEERSLKARTKRAFASGVNDQSIFGLYGSEVAARRPSLGGMFLGSAGFAVLGLFGGLMYAEEVYEVPQEIDMSYGLMDAGLSYQGVGVHMLQFDADRNEYALYNPQFSDSGTIVEFSYQENTGDALGTLYNMRAQLTGIVNAVENGTALTQEQRNIFFAADGLTILHEEETDTIERDFEELRYDYLSDQAISNKASAAITHINAAFNQIVDADQYGLSAETINDRPDHLSEGEAIVWGAAISAASWNGFLILSALLGGVAGSAGQIHQARRERASDKKKQRSMKLD